MRRRPGPSATANERCVESGSESRRKGSFSAAGSGKTAFHRRWPMTWRGRRQTGVKRKRRSGGPDALLRGLRLSFTERRGAELPGLLHHPWPNPLAVEPCRCCSMSVRGEQRQKSVGDGDLTHRADHTASGPQSFAIVRNAWIGPLIGLNCRQSAIDLKLLRYLR
jgi:hypothetical protein